MEIFKLFGPPGTGKTTALLNIMETELEKGTAPDRLAYLTFTVQARREAMTRAMTRFNLTEEDLPNFKTLHAICYRELNMTAGGMVQVDDALVQFGQSLGLTFSVRRRHIDDDMLDFPSGGEVGDRLLQIDHVRRHNLMSIGEAWHDRFDDDLDIYRVRQFVTEYEKWKKAEGLRDFTDLLEQAEDPLDVDVVIVDEAQDLSKLQWLTLHRLIVNAERLYIAGDDDQAIFTWAGADPGSFIDHPGVVKVLGQSHRVPLAVHGLALKLSERIKHRQPKIWQPRDVAGSLLVRPDTESLRYGDEGSWLVLYRHHYLVSAVESQLRLLGLPYLRHDRPAPGAEWGRSIIYWERLRRGKELTWQEVRKAVDALPVGQSGISADGKRQFMSADKKSSFNMVGLLSGFGLNTTDPWFKALGKILPADRQYIRAIIGKHGSKALTDPPSIRLSTIHAAKGAEADHVVLLTDVSRRVRETIDTNPDSERRVFYVGVSRAKQSLTVVGTDNPLFRG